MSLRVEWIHADYLATEALPAGSQVGDETVTEGHVALILHYDEAVIIEGAPASLAAALRRALAQVERIDSDDPIPPDYQPEP